MAIDPKELRIGSHILFKKKRIRVVGIPYPHCDSSRSIYWRNEDDTHYIGCDLTDDRINPISITSQLLTELGFRSRCDGKCFEKWESDTKYISFLKLEDAWIVETQGYSLDGGGYTRTLCRYLHEAENCLYLATKQELITDW